MRSRNKQRAKRNGQKEKEEPRYNRYEPTQTRKIISSYGGVGSVVETPNGSILVEPFNNWDFFKDEKLYKDERNRIDDARFLARLKTWFEKLEGLVRVPDNEKKKGFPKEPRATIAASYFPMWMFCPVCNRFDKLNNWIRKWKNTTKDNNLHPPKCHVCYHKAEKEKKKKKFVELEQVRFILTSPSGNIIDIPWDRWVFGQQGKSTAGGENNAPVSGTKTLDFEKDIPTDVYFEYITSDKFNNMTGISIVARNRSDGKQRGRKTLSGLFSLKVPENKVLFNNSPTLMKVVIKSSNSVYYPNILQSLQLPIESQTVSNESAYRLAEFQYITSKDNVDEENIEFEKIDKALFEQSKIKSIYKFNYLRMTSVQVSYTRQEPIDVEYYLQEDLKNVDNPYNTVKKRYTSSDYIHTKHLPAIENMGEGIFFEFDRDKINKWITKHALKLSERTASLQKNYDNTKISENEIRIISPEYLLIHTFSHLIIKELEFLSGYPATSLKERLYIGTEMEGVLIYTIAGAEGSYGGLVSICDDKKIGQIVASALERANDCASDPICENTDMNGQGVGGTNLAACYSCALLPETSCEEFNRFLDRMVLVHEEFGYFME